MFSIGFHLSVHLILSVHPTVDQIGSYVYMYIGPSGGMCRFKKRIVNYNRFALQSRYAMAVDSGPPSSPSSSSSLLSSLLPSG